MDAIYHECISKKDDCFFISELNSPWRKVLHLGQRQVVPKAYRWNASVKTEQFSFLHRGRVRLMAYAGGEHERILLNINAGCIFRELLFLHISPIHPVALVSLVECEIYNFSLHLLQDSAFISSYPHLFANLVQSLGIKAGTFASQIQDVEILNPQVMVCRYLHSVLRAQSGTIVNHNTSQSELALMLGLHRSTVCRVLKELREQGVIGQFTRNTLEVLNNDKLNTYCQFEECL